ncbi:hypothetical protein [Pedobacter aquatilis]|uniref:hypothetical protein n=1 Tax=Pedobacter aquatilis TaxID=351343 RepID=UPI00292ECB3F|nr:hypothetical protein [Pedobacter aquatilis]
MKRQGMIIMIDHAMGRGTITDTNAQDIDFCIDGSISHLCAGMTVIFIITETPYGLIATEVEPLP